MFIRLYPKIKEKSMRLFSLYQGDYYTACDNAADPGPAHPVRKGITQHHTDEYGINNIGIPKNRYNAGFV
jgi:hypothetical protein